MSFFPSFAALRRMQDWPLCGQSGKSQRSRSNSRIRIDCTRSVQLCIRRGAANEGEVSLQQQIQFIDQFPKAEQGGIHRFRGFHVHARSTQEIERIF